MVRTSVEDAWSQSLLLVVPVRDFFAFFTFFAFFAVFGGVGKENGTGACLTRRGRCRLALP
jgi:hypothetical protein